MKENKNALCLTSEYIQQYTTTMTQTKCSGPRALAFQRRGEQPKGTFIKLNCVCSFSVLRLQSLDPQFDYSRQIQKV